MTKKKVPNSKAAPAGQPKSSGTNSEIEPISPERSAKGDQDFKTLESYNLKGKQSIPRDSTAQRGKRPGTASKEEEENKD